MNTEITIKDILLNNVEFDGWLYLPQKKLTLDTIGIFVQSSKDDGPDSDDNVPAVAKENNWIVTIDSETVEDIVFNAKAQKEKATLNDLFNAFVHYIDNDAFIVFS